MIGQVTLNSGNNWEWSGDSLHGTTFDQRTYGEAEEKPYLYYARELKIGSTGVPAGKAGRLVEADGYRYAVKEEMNPSVLTADPGSAGFHDHRHNQHPADGSDSSQELDGQQ